MTTLLRTVTVLTTVLLIGTAAPGDEEGAADPGTGAKIDAYLSSVEPFGFSGAVLVEQDDVVIVRKGYGLANRSTAARNTPGTRFDLGSIGKQFTAALIMRLLEQGALDVDATLDTLLPDVPDDKVTITLRQLLSHASGMPYHATIPFPVRGRSLADIVPIYLEQPLQFEPGSRFGYSNPGYTLLAAIAERAGGAPFPELLRETLLEPAGLHATGHVSDADAIGGPWARAYLGETDAGAPNEWSANPEGYGAGGMVSTVDDLFIWLVALRSGTVLSPDTLAEAWRAQMPIGGTAGYGFGWFVATTPRDTNVVFHAGDYQGFNNEVRLYRDEGRLIIFLSNARLAGIGVREVVLHNIATIAAGDTVDLAPGVTSHDPARFAERAGRYQVGDDEQLTLTVTADGLRVESSSALPIRWMSTAAEAGGARWVAMVELMLEAAAGGDFEPVRALRHRAVVVRGGPTDLETVLADNTDDPAPLTWDIIGSLHAGPDGSGQTYVRAGDRLLRFDWMDDALLSISETQAASLDLRPIGPDTFAWYDLFTGRSAQLRFDGETVHLDGGATATARRL